MADAFPKEVGPPIENEIWRPIPGYEGLYEVSNFGYIRSAPRQGTAGGLMKTPRNKAGYPATCLTAMGRAKAYKVHTLVMLAFCGPRPVGLEIRHLNGDQTDNRLANLAYGTHSENVLDQVAHGTNGQTRKTHCPAGHPYDADNTLVWASMPGRRLCRTCRREKSRARMRVKYTAARVEQKLPVVK